MEACFRHDIAVVAGLTSRNPAPKADNLLLIQTGAVYAPWDHSTRAVQILEALDCGRTIEVDTGALWNRVYGQTSSTAFSTC